MFSGEEVDVTMVLTSISMGPLFMTWGGVGAGTGRGDTDGTHQANVMAARNIRISRYSGDICGVIFSICLVTISSYFCYYWR